MDNHQKDELPTAIGKEIPITNAENINTLHENMIDVDDNLYVNGIDINDKLLKVYQRSKTIRCLSIFHMILNILNCYYNLFSVIFVLSCYYGYYGAKHMKVGYTKCYLIYCMLELVFNCSMMVQFFYYDMYDFGLFLVLSLSIIIYAWIISITYNFIQNLKYDLTNEDKNIIKYFNLKQPPRTTSYVLI